MADSEIEKLVNLRPLPVPKFWKRSVQGYRSNVGKYNCDESPVFTSPVLFMVDVAASESINKSWKSFEM
jgi:hypothetical protein